MRVLVLVTLLLWPSLATAQAHFDVASIKACKPGEIAPGIEAEPSRGKTAASDNSSSSSPGTLNLPCRPLRALVVEAYVDFATGRRAAVQTIRPRIAGAPDWFESDRYAITAKSVGPATQAMMRGPMLQALLEDRFQLKLHHESREASVYELTVAKNGPKIQKTVDGTCVPRDPDQASLPPKAPGGKPWCGTVRYVSSLKTMSGILDGTGVTTAEMAPWLPFDGRPVIDRTGLEGRYDFHLEYLRGGGPPPGDPDPAHAAPPMPAAIQDQLGLKLTPAKGPVDVLVMDHVERPSGN